MSLVPFGDVYKPVKDYFTKFYNSQYLSIEGKCKTDTGLAFNPKYNQSADGTVVQECEFEKTIGLKEWAKAVVKLNLNASGKMKWESKLKDVNHLRGVAVTGVADFNTTEAGKDNFEAHVEHRYNEDFLTSIKAKLPQDKKASYEISAVAALTAKKNVLIGATSTISDSFELKDYAVGGSIKSADTQFAWTLDKSNKVKFGGLYTTPQKVVFGSEVEIGAKDLGVVVGAQTVLNGTTMRAKINNKGIVSVSAQAKLSNTVTATASSEFDTKTYSASKLGLKLEWTN